MFGDEPAELPLRKRAKQLGMSIDEGPKVDRHLSVDQVEEHWKLLPNFTPYGGSM